MKRNKYNLSNYKLATFDMGEIVPVGVTEVLPGDTVQQATSALIRVSPLMAPVMHPVHVKIHHWYVPTRLVWDDAEKFFTGETEPEHPYLQGAVTEGSIMDYMGLPITPQGFEPERFSALPFRAYNLIYNEHYRDNDIQSEIDLSKASGADSTTETTLMHCNWGADYFTKARPWSQRGDEVTIGLAGSAPVEVDDPARDLELRSAAAGGGSAYNRANFGSDASGNMFQSEINASGLYPHGPQRTLEGTADLSEASAIGIRDLRLAMALQRYAEARAKYGSRYVEYLRHLGVRSSDSRLARPEYLGGAKQTIQFSEIIQTAEGENAIGSMAGHGIGALRSNRYRRYIEEHGFIISLMFVVPITMYAQGLAKMWSRTTREDYHQRELELVGNVEVLNKEIYVGHTTPNGTFGWQQRYEEYRRAYNSIAGNFRSTLDHWHMARIFGSEPALNNDFLRAIPTKRIHAVQSEDVLWAMINHNIQARRLVGRGL